MQIVVKFKLKLNTYQTVLLKKAAFMVEFEDPNLEKYLNLDKLVKKLSIKSQSALCGKNQYHSTRIIDKNSVIIVFHPDKNCIAALHKHKINTF